MKHSLVAASVIISLGITSFAHADNKAEIDVFGNRNDISITQTGTVDNTATIAVGSEGSDASGNEATIEQYMTRPNTNASITQGGNNSTATIKQELTAYRENNLADYGISKIVQTVGTDSNTATIEQDGTGKVTITQQGGTSDSSAKILAYGDGNSEILQHAAYESKAKIKEGGDPSTFITNNNYIKQIGSELSALIKQTSGSNNNSSVYQLGNDSERLSATITVKGDRNTNKVYSQMGTDVELVLSVKGNGNTNSASQHGMESSASIGIIGHDNITDLVQNGAENTVMLTIDGSMNDADITQNGFENSSTLNIQGSINVANISQTGSFNTSTNNVTGNRNTVTVSQHN